MGAHDVHERFAWRKNKEGKIPLWNFSAVRLDS